MLLQEKFRKFREVVDLDGPTTVGDKAGLSKSTISRVYHGRYDANPEVVIDAALAAYGDKTSVVPDGYMLDSVGRLVPESMVKALDKRRDFMVRRMMQRAVTAAAGIDVLREQILAEIEKFCQTASDEYDTSLGGIKGNVQFKSFDGKYLVKRCIDDLLVFDERLQVAKALIDECLVEWSRDTPAELRVIVDDAFKVNRGRVNTKRILGLLRLDIKAEKWQQAMQAIRDSVSVAESRTYLRFYERDKTGKYQQISVGI